MLFHTPVFLVLFLPVTLAGWYGVGRARGLRAAKLWLLAASWFFYAYWDWRFLPLLLLSILFNYAVAGRVAKEGTQRKFWLLLGVILNLAVLGVFKYLDFAIASLNDMIGMDAPLVGIVLPIAISFYTFQQIAYLVDSARGQVVERSLADYALFVSFFPQLIAGPIVHHAEMMPQFTRASLLRPDAGVMSLGAAWFLMGLFKKVVLADTLAGYADPAYDHAVALSFAEGWGASLSYSFQLYFDFSGYADMAIGLGLLFGIRLPENFRAPYRAASIQAFWQRWHITLGRFLRDYLYIPLGGNRGGLGLTLRNLLLTFTLAGLWHGAAWNFVLWGALHGMALCVHRLWRSWGGRMPVALGWALTFLFVHLAWVLFRAENIADALAVYRAMMGLEGFVLPQQALDLFPPMGLVFDGAGRVPYLADGTVMGMAEMGLLLAVSFAVCLFGRPIADMKPRLLLALLVLTFAFTLHGVFFSAAPSPFIYFRF